MPVSPETRRALLEMLMACRDVIAAGFRSPDHLAALLDEMPGDKKKVISVFNADFATCLGVCDLEASQATQRAQARATRAAIVGAGSGVTSPDRASGAMSPVAEGSGTPKQSPKSPPGAATSPLMLAPQASAILLFREAVVGSFPKPPPPGADSLDVAVSGGAVKGLVHGDVAAMVQFLRRFPTAEKFLARRFGFRSDDSSPDASRPDSPAAMAFKDAVPDYETIVLPDDPMALADFGLTERATLADSLTQCNMLWAQKHPTDVEAQMRNRQQQPELFGGAGVSAQTSQASMEAQASKLLVCNLQLHYPQAQWQPLLAARDDATATLEGLRNAMAEPIDGASDELASIRSQVSVQLQQCLDRMALISYGATPDELGEMVCTKLTQALAEMTRMVHDYGIEATVATAGATGGKEVAKPSRLRVFFGGQDKLAAYAAEQTATSVHSAMAAVKAQLRMAMAVKAGTAPPAATDAPPTGASDGAAAAP